jgi:hypothetical protein
MRECRLFGGAICVAIICENEEEKELALKQAKEIDEMEKIERDNEMKQGVYRRTSKAPWVMPSVYTINELLELKEEGEYYSSYIPSYYVSKEGNDNLDGESEKTAFRTLLRAIEAAKCGFKVIKILGTLDDNSEKLEDDGSVFIIKDSGADRITIRGDLSAKGTNKRVLYITGESNIRFLYSTISDGSCKGKCENDNGGGILLNSGILTIGKGVEIKNNQAHTGGGIGILNGRVFLEGGEVRGNVADSGGGIYIARKKEINKNGYNVDDDALARRLIVTGGVVDGNSIDNIHYADEEETVPE